MRFLTLLLVTLASIAQSTYGSEGPTGCIVRIEILTKEARDSYTWGSSFQFDSYLAEVKITEFVGGRPLVEIGLKTKCIAYLAPESFLKEEKEIDNEKGRIYLLTESTQNDGTKTFTIYDGNYYYKDHIKNLLAEQVSGYNSGKRSPFFNHTRHAQPQPNVRATF